MVAHLASETNPTSGDGAACPTRHAEDRPNEPKERRGPDQWGDRRGPAPDRDRTNDPRPAAKRNRSCIATPRASRHRLSAARDTIAFPAAAESSISGERRAIQRVRSAGPAGVVGRAGVWVRPGRGRRPGRPTRPDRRRGGPWRATAGPRPGPPRAARPGPCHARPGSSPRASRRGRPSRGARRERVAAAAGVGRVARPRIIVRVGDHRGAKRVGLDVAQDGPQVLVVLHRRALEPALPDVADAAVPLVVSPGVGDEERLHDPPDGHAGLGSEDEVEVVGHQAVAVEAEQEAELRLAERGEEGVVVGVVVEDFLAVVAAAEGVEDQAVVVRSKWSSHVQNIGRESRVGAGKHC